MVLREGEQQLSLDRELEPVRQHLGGTRKNDFLGRKKLADNLFVYGHFPKFCLTSFCCATSHIFTYLFAAENNYQKNFISGLGYPPPCLIGNYYFFSFSLEGGAGILVLLVPLQSRPLEQG